MVKEYIINSKKYGQQIVLLDNNDYYKIIKENIHLLLRYDKTIDGYYVMFKTKSLGVSKIKGKDVRKNICLHRWLMNCEQDKVIDHINHNTLDNRRCNLKICTNLENQQNKRNNTSGCVGVRWHSQGKKWNARIVINSKEISLGMFNTYDEAVNARLKTLSEVMNHATL